MYHYVSYGPSGNVVVKDWINGVFAIRDTVYVQ